jgi:hypothetical protein
MLLAWTESLWHRELLTLPDKPQPMHTDKALLDLAVAHHHPRKDGPRGRRKRLTPAMAMACTTARIVTGAGGVKVTYVLTLRVYSTDPVRLCIVFQPYKLTFSPHFGR